jgi:hypothetical protein
MKVDVDSLLEECRKVRKRVSGYSKAQREALMQEARNIIGEFSVMSSSPRTQSKPLTFSELKEGETFISFPTDGDDSGHGGYRDGAWLFQKLRMSKGSDGENAVRMRDGTLTQWYDHMEVYKVG